MRFRFPLIRIPFTVVLGEYCICIRPELVGRVSPLRTALLCRLAVA